MPQKQIIQERNKYMKNQKIILQLARLLEQQNIISTSERMKMTNYARCDLCPLQHRGRKPEGCAC